MLKTAKTEEDGRFEFEYEFEAAHFFKILL